MIIQSGSTCLLLRLDGTLGDLSSLKLSNGGKASNLNDLELSQNVDIWYSLLGTV